jgi:hypothetical protein
MKKIIFTSAFLLFSLISLAQSATLIGKCRFTGPQPGKGTSLLIGADVQLYHNGSFRRTSVGGGVDYYTGDGANTTATTTDYLFVATPTSTARTWAFTFLGSQVTVTPDVTYTSQTISGETYTVYGFTNYSAVTQIYST